MSIRWMDTETKSLLAAPSNKAVAAGLTGFSLVLLEKGNNAEVLTRAVTRIAPRNLPVISRVTSSECPITIATGLDEADAILGQFELVCADAIAAFMRDEVVNDGDPEYLNNLYSTIRKSPEFACTTVHLLQVPDGEEGRSFCQQFLGDGAWHMPLFFKTLAKKARIMRHWGEKLGCNIVVEGSQPGPST